LLSLGIAPKGERENVVLTGKLEADLAEDARVQVVSGCVGDGDAQLHREDADHALFVDELHVDQRLPETPAPLSLMAEGRLELVLVEETRVDQELA
jgi:hypothetical protein